MNPHSRTMHPPQPDTPIRVLVVEDNQDLARLFCDLLDVMGCETDMAFTARSALDLARRNPPDLVFCDLRLPGEKDGFDVAKEMRADESLAAIRLIAVSGLTDVDEQKRALDAGFDRIFAKPVKFAQIQEVLADYRRV
jgi:CheY-like chemotaxis protein